MIYHTRTKIPEFPKMTFNLKWNHEDFVICTSYYTYFSHLDLVFLRLYKLFPIFSCLFITGRISSRKPIKAMIKVVF